MQLTVFIKGYSHILKNSYYTFYNKQSTGGYRDLRKICYGGKEAAEKRRGIQVKK
jgi:hypothetical protein